jgi:ATP-dependent Clp protease ATP-binding subunit ClpA
MNPVKYNSIPGIAPVLQIASRFAKENMHATYGAPHLLRALLHKDFPLLKQLEAKDVDVYYLDEWGEIRMEQYPRASRPVDEPGPDDSLAPLFREAESVQSRLRYNSIEPECLMIALSTPGVVFTYEQLKTYPLSSAQMLQWYESGAPAAVMTEAGKQSAGATAAKSSSGAGGTENLQKYCTDKLKEAQNGKLLSVIGRDKEIRQICEIISRRSKSNVIITGEAGVGKSALLSGFALAVAEERVPLHLRNVSIYELDNGALVAGASYKGEIEDRIRKITQELAGMDKPILVIDEIHTLIDRNNPNGGVTSILKAELAKGILTVICTTTIDEYRKSIEKDETFSRRFEMIKLQEPDTSVAEKMLRNQAKFYEEHHQLGISDDVFMEAIRLAKRFIKDRKLPDSALDLLDRTLAVCRMNADTALGDVGGFTLRLSEMADEPKEDDLKWLYREVQTGLSPVLLARHDEDREFNKLQATHEMKEYLTRMFESLAGIAALEKMSIDVVDLSAVVANITGIPLGKVQTKEQSRLVNMENHLRERVIGQDHALRTVADAILESRSGLNKSGQPIASFFFLGPTGTGKTELAKSLAEFMFEDENSIIRFDMSEFKEEHSAALLYGAPPGYVGYEEGGMLVNKIRQQPYAIVLFDEIEKAHPSVFDIFLQILDEGKMHDRLGKEGDFSNAIILFTSNIGAEHIIESFGKGIIPRSEDMMDIMSRYFRPEFLARVTEIVPFAPVSKENVLKIFNIHLKPLIKQLQLQGIEMEVTPEAADYLANLGFTPRYGVRPLKGVIRTSLRKPLSRMIVNAELIKGQVVKAYLNNEGVLSWDIITPVSTSE